MLFPRRRNPCPAPCRHLSEKSPASSTRRSRGITIPPISLFVHRYTLRPLSALSPRAGDAGREGALLRVGRGHACLQPWPELGDPTLDECLANLGGTSLGRRALACAAADGQAREEGRSLFRGLSVPESHATLPALSDKALEAALAQGFSTVKTKAGADPAPLAPFLKKHRSLRWRIDFNSAADEDALTGFLLALPGETRRRIDFLEDPFPPEGANWKRLAVSTGIPLAADRETPPPGDAAFAVIKPASQETAAALAKAEALGQAPLITSNMDHPLGQAFAAWQAAIHAGAIATPCGLQTHPLFEPSAFSACLGPPSPRFTPPPGTGLGFDDLLRKIPWTPP